MNKELIIRIVLSLFIGIFIGLVVLLFGESTSMLLNSLIVALAYAAILYMLFEDNNLKVLIAIVAFIIGFFLHGSLLEWSNMNAQILFAILYWGPYVALVFLLSLTSSQNNKPNE